MTVITAPRSFTQTRRTCFLAGSIDNGAAVDWQSSLAGKLDESGITSLNPRRRDWDASWDPTDDTHPELRAQIEWELAAMEHTDVIAMYFAPRSKAPITLLELGLHARSGKLIVCCPKPYWRRANVLVVCQRYGVPVAANLDELAEQVRIKLS